MRDPIPTVGGGPRSGQFYVTVANTRSMIVARHDLDSQVLAGDRKQGMKTGYSGRGH